MYYYVDTKALKKAMIDAGVDSIQALADKTGINRNTIGELVNGKTYPSSNVMQRVATALELTGEQCGAIFFAR